MKCKLADIAEFNPKETIKKGTVAKKIAMDKLRPFCRDIPEYELAPFTGGAKFRNGDTIMARITPCLENGKTAKVNVLETGEVGFGSTEFLVFRANKNITDEDYLYYLVCSPIVRDIAIKSMIGSSGRQRVQTDVVQNIEIDLPSLGNQKRIGNLLRSLDDKIELNNKINANLEQQAQAVFTAWFAEAKPSVSFVSLVRVLGGGTPRTSVAEFWDGEIPFFTPKDVHGVYTFETEKSLTDEGLAHCNSCLFPINTVFVTARGTVGKLTLAGRPMAMNQSCYALLGQEGYGQYFVYHLAQRVITHLKHKATGAVFDAIVTRDFESEFVPDIKPSEAANFEFKVKPLYEVILRNYEENCRLSALRDMLLQRLLSGACVIS